MTLISGYQSTTVTNLFQYDPSLNPTLVSLSRNRSGIAGENADVYWASSGEGLLVLMVLGQREFRSIKFDLTLFVCFLLNFISHISC